MASIDMYRTKAGITMYRARVQRKGQKTQTATFSSLRECRKWATMIEGEILASRRFPHKSKHTLSELLEKYTTDVLPRKTPETARSQMPVIRYWQQKLGYMLLDDIEPRHIITCRDEIARQSAPATVVKYLMVLSHAFTVALKDYFWIESNLCLLIRKPSLPPGRSRYLSDEERTRLLISHLLSHFLATNFKMR
jgi:hypothetical protein